MNGEFDRLLGYGFCIGMGIIFLFDRIHDWLLLRSSKRISEWQCLLIAVAVVLITVTAVTISYVVLSHDPNWILVGILPPSYLAAYIVSSYLANKLVNG